MSSPPIQSVEDPTEEDVQEKVKQLKSTPPPRSKLEAFLRKELEFLGAAQTMIGLICCFFGVTHEFILDFLKPKKDLFSASYMGYPIWGGLLFTISGSLLIASERKGAKYLIQSSLVMAVLSSVVAGIGIKIVWSNLKQTSSIFQKCQNQQIGEFCFAVTFLTETAIMVLFLTVLELGIGILLSVNELIGKIVEIWIAKHHKTYQEALYEELAIYDPVAENIELQRDTRTESRESLQSRIYQLPEELQKT
ncbi:high affinity immunoglobulin epsilon receptor subunit beta isoform X1 [Vombatus ursinus]|uniref:Membrane spanning 4-domains A2 n=1 Tax=Vombatus ursinus TaxID=29139 RepID=A0A4X2L1X3_VOMUR|nr:high affinity immunoglobulin epsilon receptor subunit beta isoform X1 [Vombatus ursinus]